MTEERRIDENRTRKDGKKMNKEYARHMMVEEMHTKNVYISKLKTGFKEVIFDGCCLFGIGLIHLLLTLFTNLYISPFYETMLVYSIGNMIGGIALMFYGTWLFVPDIVKNSN